MSAAEGRTEPLTAVPEMSSDPRPEDLRTLASAAAVHLSVCSVCSTGRVCALGLRIANARALAAVR